MVVRMAIEVGDLATAASAVERTLAAARKIVSGLLEEGGPAVPGSLVRLHDADPQEVARR